MTVSKLFVLMAIDQDGNPSEWATDPLTEGNLTPVILSLFYPLSLRQLLSLYSWTYSISATLIHLMRKFLTGALATLSGIMLIVLTG